MVPDRRLEVERRARAVRIRRQLPRAFGEFIAGLAPWDWFINPFTFRDLGPQPRANSAEEVERNEKFVRLAADPRLRDWTPSSRYTFFPGPPAPEAALALIRGYLSDLQLAAGRPIGWVLGEEFGGLGGRYHCHALITGTAHLRRDVWWERAFEEFGRTRIEPFDPQKAAAYYTAKYAAKQLGGLHFGGILAGVDLAEVENRPPVRGGGIDVTRSAELPRQAFHNTLGRWHR